MNEPTQVLTHTQATELWSKDTQLAEIKKVYGANLSDSEFQIFIQIGKATGLNPFLKQLWAVKYGNSPAQIFIGRDGYRISAQRNPDYDFHIADAVYENDDFKIENGEVKHSYNVKQRGSLAGAYCIVKRKRSSKPVFTYIEFKEYSTGKSLWNSKPATMIKKVAEAQGLRMAFQEMFSGTYSDSEDWNVNKDTHPIGSGTPNKVIEATSNGNPKGTMTTEQNAKLYALIGELGSSKEKVEEFVNKQFGCRISGLSKAQASNLIEVMQKKADDKNIKPTEPIEVTPIEKDQAQTIEDVADAFGGEVLQQTKSTAGDLMKKGIEQAKK